jgi:glycosyltransferase involved in cell wall biosynthesis
MSDSTADKYYLNYLKSAYSFPRSILNLPKTEWVLGALRALPRGARILDAGCGAGQITRPLMRDHRITGVDVQADAIDWCQRQTPEALRPAGRRKPQSEVAGQGFVPEYKVADLQALPYARGSFDAVVFCNAIEHLVDPHPMLAELAWVMKPGGIMLLTTENCDSWLWVFAENTWYRVFGGNCKPYLPEVHPQRYTPTSFRSDVQRHLEVETLFLGVHGMEMFMLARKPFPARPARPRGKQKVVVVMPAYNAAKTLEKTYHDIPAGVVHQVILVDDFSKDDTVGVARRLRLKTFTHTQNTGYGGNQKTCYREALKAGADVVVMLHPDYQYDSRCIPEMITPILAGRADFVMGSRIIGEGALKGGMPLWKYVANRFLTSAENLVLNQRFSDLHTGFRAYSRRFLMSVPFMLNDDDFHFDTQVIAQGNIKGFPSTEIPIPTRYFSEASSVGFRTSVRYGLQTLRVMLQLSLQRLGLKRWDYLDRDLFDVLDAKDRKAIFGPKAKAAAGRLYRR